MFFIIAIVTRILMSLFYEQSSTDSTESSYIFETDGWPSHDREIPSIGNGHLATVLYSDTVYMNGLYNGFQGESHRARIPSRNNIRILFEKDVEIVRHTFTLNIRRGVFTETFLTPSHSVELHTYAHRYFHKAIVSQLHVKRLSPTHASSLTLNISSNPGKPSEDVEFEPEVHLDTKSPGVEAPITCGHTITVENPKYQHGNSTVCVAATVPPKSVTVEADTEDVWYTYYTAYDSTREGALEDFYAVSEVLRKPEGHEKLLQSHTERWEFLWNEGRIEIGGNLELAKSINGALYYMLSSLPISTKTNSAVGPFCGLSPSGLPYGTFRKDYQGHSFWDTEIWIFPVVLNFHPTVAKELLNYRLRKFEVAEEHAKETGWEGARYPWESAFTGSEVTPSTSPGPRDLQIHITGDISFAIQQYIATTFDTDWLKSGHQEHGNTNTTGTIPGTVPGTGTSPCDQIRAIAQFWVSRGNFNASTSKFDINDVMPPDEDNYPVNNSIYTNVVASKSILFAKYVEKLCPDQMEPIPESWLTFARSLTFQYDPTLNYHPEYDGYEVGKGIKQADVVLLGYPLLHKMDPSTRRNDLKIYENVTRTSGPAMTWAMHAIGHLELNDLEKAEALFSRSYKPYVTEPFKTWTENTAPNFGANNFLTGMGGFLQTIVNGFAGLRIHNDKLIFLNPRLPPNTTRLEIHGLKYLGNSLNLIVDNSQVQIRVTAVHANFPLTVETNTEIYLLTQEKEVTLALGGITEITIHGPALHTLP